MAEIVEQVQEREAAHVSHQRTKREKTSGGPVHASGFLSCAFPLVVCFRQEEKRIDLPAASQHR